MKKEDIHIWDWKRILIGSAPWEFLIETFFRTLIIYILLLMAMRLMGKRMSGQLSILELCIIVMLGAIVSVPMEVPDRGLLVGLFILLITVLLQRQMNLLAFLNTKFEKFTQGQMSIVIKDGKLQLKELEKVSISREILFSKLRKKNIYQLGEIKRVYVESCGLISIYKNKSTKPGLGILPYKDQNIRNEYQSKNGLFAHQLWKYYRGFNNSYT
jgi:uncharacterized membrane protein YcaP (DUF421 family)